MLRPETENNRAVIVSLLTYTHRIPADCGGGGRCNIGVRDADKVGAIWISLDFHLWAVGAPVVPQHGNARGSPNDVHDLGCDSPKGSDILALGSRVGICLACNKDLDRSLDWVRLQLSHCDPCSRDLFIQLILKRSDQLWSGLLVAHLHNYLRIVGLSRFGSDGKPETWSPASDKTRDASQETLCSRLLHPRRRSTFNNFAHHLLRPHCSIVGCAQGNIVGQPDVEVKPILDILRKKLRLKL